MAATGNGLTGLNDCNRRLGEQLSLGCPFGAPILDAAIQQ